MRCLDPRRPLFGSGLVIAVAPARCGNHHPPGQRQRRSAVHGLLRRRWRGSGRCRQPAGGRPGRGQSSEAAGGLRQRLAQQSGDATDDRVARSGRAPGAEACYSKLPLPSALATADSVGAHFPPLAGQPVAYLAAQLEAWHHVTRHNDSLQLMHHLSAALSVQDIRDVAAWFAALPLPAPEIAP